MANQKAWDALPKDLQQVVLDSYQGDEPRGKGVGGRHRLRMQLARKQLPELGMTVVDPPKEELEKARKAAKAAWDTWLQRTGADGKRGMDLALKALGR